MTNRRIFVHKILFEFRIEDWFLEVELLGQMVCLKAFWYILSVLFLERGQSIIARESSAQLEDENHLMRKAVFTCPPQTSFPHLGMPGILWEGDKKPYPSLREERLYRHTWQGTEFWFVWIKVQDPALIRGEGLIEVEVAPGGTRHVTGEGRDAPISSARGLPMALLRCHGNSLILHYGPGATLPAPFLQGTIPDSFICKVLSVPFYVISAVFFP